MKQHQVARIQVRCANKILVQGHQVVKASGVIRVREWPNISETIEEGETPHAAAVRGLQEELSLDVNPDEVRFVGAFKEIKPSPTTGEGKDYTFYDFLLAIPPASQQNIPLSVDEGEVVTHFCWVEIGDESLVLNYPFSPGCSWKS